MQQNQRGVHMSKGFKCKKCALCCRNLDKNDIYLDLHNGDGICIYLDRKRNLCTIYDTRPTLCNIDKSFEKYFSAGLTLVEYYNLNYKGCNKIWEIEKKKSQKQMKQ